MCRGWMEMKRFFPPSPQWKTYHKGKTNPVLIMPLKSQMAPIHDFMVFLVELKRIVVYSNAQIFFFLLDNRTDNNSRIPEVKMSFIFSIGEFNFNHKDRHAVSYEVVN